jgi:hypothetical protein
MLTTQEAAGSDPEAKVRLGLTWARLAEAVRVSADDRALVTLDGTFLPYPR